jgi:hypothetical protein
VTDIYIDTGTALRRPFFLEASREGREGHEKAVKEIKPSFPSREISAADSI